MDFSFLIPYISTIITERIKPKVEKILNDLEMDFNVNLTPMSDHFKEYLMRTYKKYYYVNTLALKDYIKVLKEIYQPLQLEYRTLGDTKTTEPISGYPVELLEKHHKLRIVDTAGMGKSTMVKRMFLDVVENGYGIPIFIELRRLSEQNTILNEILRQVGSIVKEFDVKLMQNLISSGGFIFFMDGYDEIPSVNKTAVTQDIQDFIDKADNNRFVLTSRPEDSLSCFGNFQLAKIVSLKKSEAYELLRRYDKNGEVSSLLIGKLESGKYAAIDEFLKNPLLVSLLYAAFDFKQTIPLKKSNFYRQVFDAYFESHDLTKGGGYTHEKKCGLDIDGFDKILRRMAYECLRRQSIEYPKDTILEIIAISGKDYPTMRFVASDFLNDLEHSVPLLCVDGTLHKWVHKSIQEYFAAEYICRDTQNFKTTILKAMYNSSKLENYVNLLDLYYDIDDITFNICIIKPLLEEYLDFYSSHIVTIEGISQESIDDRISLLFMGNTVIGKWIDNGGVKTVVDEMRVIMKQAVGKDLKTCNAYWGKICIGHISEAKSKILNLLPPKLPRLFRNISDVAIAGIPRYTESSRIIDVCTFCEDSTLYEGLNKMLCKDFHYSCIRVSEVKSYLKWISDNLENRHEDDITAGL